MKPEPSTEKPDGKPKFAPRESHVDFNDREQEKANSQRLTHTGPQGAEPAGNSKPDTPSNPKTGK